MNLQPSAPKGDDFLAPIVRAKLIGEGRIQCVIDSRFLPLFCHSSGLQGAFRGPSVAFGGPSDD